MKKASIFVMIASVASKLVGFVRDTLLAGLYGSSPIADAFVYTYGLPSQVFSIVIAAFVTGFIPMYTRIEQEEGENRANRFTNNVLNTMIVLAIIVSTIIFLFTEQVVAVLLPNSTPESLVYIIPFLKVSVFSLLFTCVVQVMTGFLQIKKAYVIPMLMGFPLNFVLIAVMYLSKSLGAHILPYGIVLAYAFQASIILGVAWMKGFKFNFVIDTKDEHMKYMLIIAIPLIIGSASITIGNMFNQGIVSGITGGLSYLNYSARVGNIVESIFSLSIISVMYPSISKAIALGHTREAQTEFGKSIVSVLVFVVPSAIGMIVLANPIIQFIYLRGEFNMSDVLTLTPVLRNYAFAIVPISVYNLSTRVFYSYQDNRTPMFISVSVIIIQIILSLILSKFYGVAGVTLGIAIAYTLGMIVMLWRVGILFKDFNPKKYVRQVIKVFIAGILMGVVAFITYKLLSVRIGVKIALLATMMVAVVVYGLAIIFLRVEAVDELVGGLKRKLGR